MGHTSGFSITTDNVRPTRSSTQQLTVPTSRQLTLSAIMKPNQTNKLQNLSTGLPSHPIHHLQQEPRPPPQRHTSTTSTTHRIYHLQTTRPNPTQPNPALTQPQLKPRTVPARLTSGQSASSDQSTSECRKEGCALSLMMLRDGHARGGFSRYRLRPRSMSTKFLPWSKWLSAMIPLAPNRHWIPFWWLTCTRTKKTDDRRRRVGN